MRVAKLNRKISNGRTVAAQRSVMSFECNVIYHRYICTNCYTTGLVSREQNVGLNKFKKTDNKKVANKYIETTKTNKNCIKVKLSRYTPWRHMGGEEV
jgi:hypothetical protein